MAEEMKAVIMQLRPHYQQLRDERVYTEVQVKRMLFAFARDLGCDMEDEELREFIDSGFDFD
jgi:hypothetical protein